MKFTQSFKKNICHAILLGFISHICGTVALAVERPTFIHVKSPITAPVEAQSSPVYMPSNEHGLDALIVEIVRTASVMDVSETHPSLALMRCYDRIINGHTTLVVQDVLQAMPELLRYAVTKHESRTRAERLDTGTRSYDSKAPRPQNPYDPSAVVGPILVNTANAECAGKPCDYDKLEDIIALLLIIKKRIGTVSDDVCENSVLGVLGDACEILGMSISEALKDLLESSSINCCDEIIATITTCCQSLHIDIDELIQTVSVITQNVENVECLVECKFGEFNECACCDDWDNCDDNCSTCCRTFDNVSEGLSEIYCTLTQLTDIVETDFEITWSLIENITTGSNCCNQTNSLLHEILDTLTQCCDDLADDIFDTLTILSADIADLKETLTECCEDLANDIFDTQTLILLCCEQTHSDFKTTWSLLEECCEITQTSFEATWSLIEACCEQTQSNFETTWSLLEQLEISIDECCEQTRSNFIVTWSLIENIEVTTSVDFTEVLTALAACCQSTSSAIDECCEQTNSNFEITWSLLQNVRTTCSLIVDLTPVLDAIDDVQATLTACCQQEQTGFETTWSLIDSTQASLLGCCQETQSAINNLNFTCSLSLNLEPVLDAIDQVEATLTACCAQDETNFETTWSLIDDIFVDLTGDLNSSTSTIINALLSKNLCPCKPTPLSQEDVVAGTIALTTSGVAYCMAENIVGNIVIAASQVAIEMNNKQLNGLVTINDNQRDITIKNGHVLSPVALTESAATIRLGTTTNGRVSHVQLLNLNVSCDPTSAPSSFARDGINCQGSYILIDQCTISGERASTTGFDAGRALTMNGSYIQISNNTLISGDGGSTAGDIGTSSGFVLVTTTNGSNNYYKIVNNILLSGTAGNGTIGAGGSGSGMSLALMNNSIISHNRIVTSDSALPASTATSPTSPSGTGIIVESGSHVIFAENEIKTGQVQNSQSSSNASTGSGIVLNGSSHILITKNSIKTGDGLRNNASSTASGRGSDTGRGIDILASPTSENIQITQNTISVGNAAAGRPGTINGGNGGDGGDAIHVSGGTDIEIQNNSITKAGNGGNRGTGGTATGGNGGHGIVIENGTTNVEIRLNTISNTGIGGTSGGLPGRAINDLQECPADSSAGGFTVTYNNFAYAIADTTIRYLLNGIVAEAGASVTVATNELDNVYVDSCAVTPVNLTDCCAEIVSTLTTDFAITVSLLNAIDTSCDFTEVLTSLSQGFVETWSLIGTIENEFVTCCVTTQSLINAIGSAATAQFVCGAPIRVSTITTITTPGYYCLSQDITASVAGPIITIDADNVILDLNGYTITNLDGAGQSIASTNHTNVTIRGGVVTAATGIQLQTMRNTLITEMQAVNCTLLGINSVSAQLLEISRSQFRGNSSTLNVTSGQNLQVTQCAFYNLITGGAALNVTNVTNGIIDTVDVTENTVGNFAVLFSTSSLNITIKNSNITSNVSTGALGALGLTNSNNFTIDSVSVTGNRSQTDSVMGMQLQSCSGVQILNSVAATNTSDVTTAPVVAGFYMNGCSASSIINCAALNHTSTASAAGIQLESSAQISLNSNQVNANNFGIVTDSPTSTLLLIFNNTARNVTQNYVGPMPIVNYNLATGVLTSPVGNITSFDNISAA